MLSDYQRALITGGTGFIGGRLAERLLRVDALPVRILARSPAKAVRLQALGAEIAEGDVTDPSSLRSAIKGCDLIFHAAGWVGEGGARDHAWAVNVRGTQYVLDLAAELGVRRVVHLSSCAVYGSRQQLDIDETTPMRMTGAVYGDSKVAAEEVLWRCQQEHGLPVVAARASQVYGLDSPQFTLRLVEAIRSGRMMLIDGERHFCKPIYIDNLVDGLILCADSDAAVGEAFNFSDGEPVPWREFLGAYARMVGVAKLRSVPYPLAWSVALFLELKAAVCGKKSDTNRRALRSFLSSNSFSNRKARAVLHWEPQVDMSEGMRRTEAFLRERGYLNKASNR